MTEGRSKVPAAIAAVLLASCAGVDDRQAGLQAERPQPAAPDVRPAAPPAEAGAEVADAGGPVGPAASLPASHAEESIVVSGTRLARQDFESRTPVVTVDAGL